MLVPFRTATLSSLGLDAGAGVVVCATVEGVEDWVAVGLGLLPPFSADTANTITATPRTTPPKISNVVRPEERSCLKYFGPEPAGAPDTRAAPVPETASPPPARGEACLRAPGSAPLDPAGAGGLATAREATGRDAATGADGRDAAG